MQTTKAPVVRQHEGSPGAPELRQPSRPGGSGYQPRTQRDEPWQPESLMRLLAQVGLGLGGLLACAVGSARQEDYENGLVWVAAAVAFTALAACGMVGWLVTGARRLQAEQVAVLTEVVALLPEQDALGDEALGAVTFLAAPQMTRFHAPGCFLLHGRSDVVAVDPSGRTPCGVCLEEVQPA